jgi:hypothetical protein
MRKKLEMLRNVYLENIKGRDHVKDLENFKMNLKEKILGWVLERIRLVQDSKRLIWIG